MSSTSTAEEPAVDPVANSEFGESSPTMRTLKLRRGERADSVSSKELDDRQRHLQRIEEYEGKCIDILLDAIML